MKDSIPITTQPEILYQDVSVLVILKPAGLLSIPDGYNLAVPHVAGILAAQYGKLWIVHRLDRDTSGVLILAKSRESHKNLNLQFEHREVIKIYHTLIYGQPGWDKIQINIPLRINGDRKHRTLADPVNGKPAQTNFAVLARYPSACLVEAVPHSGYTHQIRAHLAAIGLPIMGDQIYYSIQPIEPYQKIPNSSGIKMIGRVALHARSISFRSPGKGQTVVIEAAYPEDLQTALEKIKKSTPHS